MKKQILIDLISSNHKLKYPKFLRDAEEKTASVAWGMGIGDPYSLEPYRMELLGIKPGRMLKNASKPARNRYRYAFDKYGNVIHNLEYTFLGGPPGDKAWNHTDDFYEWHKDYVIRYHFGSVARDGVNATLYRVVLAELVDGKVVKSYQLDDNRDDSYNEMDYCYENGVLKRIILTWPDGIIPQREFVIIQEPVGVSIWEPGDKGMELIYSPK